jgi:hypothetical protein
MLADTCHVAAAPEPTNIVWENLEVSRRKRNINKVIVGFFIILFIIAMFLLFGVLKSQSAKNKIKYPASTDCESISTMFVGNIANCEKEAEYDKSSTENNNGLGYYQCYCKLHSSDATSLCDMYTYDYFIGLSLRNAVTVLVSVVNILIRTINIKLID